MLPFFSTARFYLVLLVDFRSNKVITYPYQIDEEEDDEILFELFMLIRAGRKEKQIRWFRFDVLLEFENRVEDSDIFDRPYRFSNK